MENIVIVGSGGFAKEVAFLIKEINQQTPKWNLLGYIDREIGKKVQNLKVIENDEWLQNCPDKINAVVGIGNPSIIEEIATNLNQNKNISFPNLIHPNNIGDWDNINLGHGNIISSGCNLTTDITIKNFNIINLDSTIGHDAIIESYNVFNPSCNISGGVNIKNACLIGTGASILENISISSKVIIGAGGIVTKNITEKGVYVGVPAKKIK